MIDVLFLLLVSTFNIISANSINISLELSNNGFHRDFNYLVEYTEGCDLLLQQSLPKDVYINTNQLDDLQRLKKLTAIYNDHIDVELPARKSKPFSVFVKVPGTLESVRLPIHFRYQSPGDKRFAYVQLEPPQLYTSCEQGCFAKEFLRLENNSEKQYQDKCAWKRVSYELELKTPLKVAIPIGDVSLHQIVTFLTILIGWTGCAIILYTAHTKIIVIEKKLMPQHMD